MSAPSTAAAPSRRVGRLERAAIAGVMSRELTVFRHYWPSTTFSSIVQPTIYLLAFGLGFAAFGVMLSAAVESIDSFSYVNSAVITPLFLVAGSFFPIDQLPQWAQTAAWFNPLYSCVELVRHACFGFQLNDLAHLGILLVFGVVMWRLAIRNMGRQLID